MSTSSTEHDVIHYDRPNWMDAETWQGIVADLSAHFVESVLAARA